MNFDLSEFASFRAEVGAWVVSRWPEGFAPRFESRSDPGYAETTRATQRALGKRGWLCGGWPIEYGGQAWRKLQQVVFNETMAYRRVPLNSLGNTTIGPTLIVYGTDDQKTRFLPGMAKGSIFWSQGFSEPNAGSDLASLQTRAVADGDDFIINGVKLWGEHRFADYCLLLARSDPEAPKHRGITQFVLPLKGTPGITVQPIRDANGLDRWSLMTLEDVRLPRSAVIGEVNRGWYQTTTSLDFERSQVSWVGNGRRVLESLVRYAANTQRGGIARVADPFIRDRLGELAVELEMAKWLAYRVAYLQDQGMIPNSEASISKVWSTEMLQRLLRAGINVAGVLGLQLPGSEWLTSDGSFSRDYWDAPGHTFAGGASEVQRNIIATRGFGLPR